jgi:hypothetical protein
VADNPIWYLTPLRGGEQVRPLPREVDRANALLGRHHWREPRRVIGILIACTRTSNECVQRERIETAFGMPNVKSRWLLDLGDRTAAGFDIFDIGPDAFRAHPIGKALVATMRWQRDKDREAFLQQVVGLATSALAYSVPVTFGRFAGAEVDYTYELPWDEPVWGGVPRWAPAARARVVHEAIVADIADGRAFAPDLTDAMCALLSVGALEQAERLAEARGAGRRP